MHVNFDLQTCCGLAQAFNLCPSIFTFFKPVLEVGTIPKACGMVSPKPMHLLGEQK